MKQKGSGIENKLAFFSNFSKFVAIITNRFKQQMWMNVELNHLSRPEPKFRGRKKNSSMGVSFCLWRFIKDRIR